MFRFFENLVDPFCDYAPQDTPPQTRLAFLLSYAKPFRLLFVAAALLSVLSAAIELLLIWATGWVVDLLAGDPAEVWADHGTALILLALFVLILRPILGFIDVASLNNAILPNVTTLVRWRAHGHVLRQSVGWFENDFAGRVANRVAQMPRSIGEVTFQIFDALAYALAYGVGALVVLGVVDLRLMLPLALWLALYGALVWWTVTRIGPASEASSDARSEFSGRVVDAYTNIHTVKSFAHHDSEMAYARDAIVNTRATLMREMRLFSMMDALLMTLNGFLIVAVVGWGIALWMQGQASAGAVAAAAALTLRLNAMTGWIMWSLTSLFQELGMVSEAMRSVAQPIALTDAQDAGALVMHEGEIAVHDLSHHYGRETGGIEQVSLTISPGQRVGLVGRSGAGKSTLLKLLLRFYDAESGRIEIDGQDIAKVTQHSLRAQIGMVQQESSLLHRSVRDNILYGRPDATEAEVIAAAKQAQAHGFILDLEDPKGGRAYDAQVGERGVKLSGGQRQRIALARVILKDAPILLLDEATSALDSEVEAAIQDTLYGMMEGKTVIAIAHRLSTIARMDRILVLDAGKIVEDGDHEALLSKGGLYAEFWARQSGGFLDPDRQPTQENP